MRKFTLLLLCLLMLVAPLLVSCGKKDKGSTGTTTGTTTTPGDPGGTTTEPPQTKWSGVDFGGETITIQLSAFTNAEFSSGGQKYMEGPGQVSSDSVQNLVFERNVDAMGTLNLQVNYVYLNSGWGQISQQIVTSEASGQPPDMYVDMIYDMATAAMSTCFRNAKSVTPETGRGYFTFAEEDGFLTNFINDMSLSDDKAFLLGSDYFIDMVRAMFVMPVNITMYESKVDDIADFYQSIIRGEWTWDRLIELANQIYNDTNVDSKSDMGDLLVFAAERGGGKTSSGILYSTDINVVQVEPQPGGGYLYTYRPSNEDLPILFETIGRVFSTKGVAVAGGGLADENVAAIRAKFAEGSILFAGAVMLGSIEEDDYQNMSDSFGLVPLPKLSEDRRYNTLIHNVGRCGALSLVSPNFRPVSAFVQFCTEVSDPIIKEYYNVAMKYKYTNDPGTAEMLDMIYDNIVSNREKMLEDLISVRNSAVQPFGWSRLLTGNDFDFTTNATQIASLYAQCVQAKQVALDSILTDWNLLPSGLD